MTASGADWVHEGRRLLPDELRTTLELAYLLSLSCVEIATVMGCAEASCRRY